VVKSNWVSQQIIPMGSKGSAEIIFGDDCAHRGCSWNAIGKQSIKAHYEASVWSHPGWQRWLWRAPYIITLPGSYTVSLPFFNQVKAASRPAQSRARYVNTTSGQVRLRLRLDGR